MPKFLSNTVQLHVIKFDISSDSYKQLILKRSPSTQPYPLMWQAITGRIEPNETALQAAVRELQEEASLQPYKLWTLPYVASFFNTINDTVGFAPVFVCEVEGTSEVKLSKEHTDFLWIELEHIAKFVKLPSHIEATKCLIDFIINNEDNFYYQIDKSLWKK